ncbi:MAG: hypothetical protein ACR2MO_13420 [Acidimicrobiales bacterium]
MSPRLQLQLEIENDIVHAGDTVRGTILVVEGGRSRTLTASLEFHERTEDAGRVARSAASERLHDGDLLAGMSFSFALRLPDDALPNFRSEHGSLTWELHAHSDELGPDTHEHAEVPVSPRRQAP